MSEDKNLEEKSDLEILEGHIKVYDEMMTFARKNHIYLPLFKQKFSIGGIEYVVLTDNRAKLFELIVELIESCSTDFLENINYYYVVNFTYN